MLNKRQLLTKIHELIEDHLLWDEVEKYSGRSRGEIDRILQGGSPLTTTEMYDLCHGLAVNEYDLYEGKEVVPAPTAWQRNLDRHGVQYRLSVSEKDQPDASFWIQTVKLELTPEDWCALCMREGAYYVGPCCGTCSAMQDIVNGVFHNGGWMADNDLRELSKLSKRHDGEDSHCLNVSLLSRWSSRIKALTPWERIGCLCQLVDGNIRADQDRSRTEPSFDDLQSLLSNLKAGKPVAVSPELRELAERVAQQSAERAEYERLHPMTEEEALEWARWLAWTITEGDD